MPDTQCPQLGHAPLWSLMEPDTAAVPTSSHQHRHSHEQVARGPQGHLTLNRLQHQCSVRSEACSAPRKPGLELQHDVSLSNSGSSSPPRGATAEAPPEHRTATRETWGVGGWGKGDTGLTTAQRSPRHKVPKKGVSHRPHGAVSQETPTGAQSNCASPTPAPRPASSGETGRGGATDRQCSDSCL